MTHDERIERIARAICIAMGDDPDREGRRLTAYDGMAEAAYRATLEAIREPSEGMLREAKIEMWEDFGALSRVWHAMIDALLNAKPTVEDERIAAMENK